MQEELFRRSTAASIGCKAEQNVREGVNFINILCTSFLYKSFVQNFFVIEGKVKFFTGAKKLAQLRSQNVGEIDSRKYIWEKKFRRKNIWRP
jgi:hypothetical protein